MEITLFKSQKHVFWQALVITVIIFGIGVFFGFVLENWRTGRIKDFYLYSEIDLLDIRVQNEVYSLNKINCDTAIEENIKFADKTYEEAKFLKEYEDAARFSESLILQHKKYDLLRTLFWINSMKIKKKCNADYHNIVYLYDYIDPGVDIEAKQKVFSRLLEDLKKEYGNRVMLIPIAGDNDLVSVKLLMAQYNVKEEELPVILIDEKTKIKELEKKEDIGRFLK